MRYLLPDDASPPEAVLVYDGAKPVYFGHYWLRAATPLLVSDIMACLG